MRILVVDDNETNRVVAQLLLERRGHDVLVASCGPSALECMAKEVLDVVLMDLSMPGMDGLETTRRIRSDDVNGELTVVALTAHTSPKEQKMCLDAGMNAFMRKPFDSLQVDRLMGLLNHNSKDGAA